MHNIIYHISSYIYINIPRSAQRVQNATEPRRRRLPQLRQGHGAIGVQVQLLVAGQINGWSTDQVMVIICHELMIQSVDNQVKISIT